MADPANAIVASRQLDATNKAGIFANVFGWYILSLQ